MNLNHHQLWVHPLFRVVNLLYATLLANLPKDIHASIDLEEYLDDDGTREIGIKISATCHEGEILLLVKQADEVAVLVGYSMLTGEEVRSEEDIEYPEQIMELQHTADTALIVRRIINFLVHGVKPEELGGEGE